MKCSQEHEKEAEPVHRKKKRDLLGSSLIPVSVSLERAVNTYTNVISLLLAQSCELGAKSWQMQPSHLLIQVLREQVDIVLVRLVSIPVPHEVQLRQDLVGERA